MGNVLLDESCCSSREQLNQKIIKRFWHKAIIINEENQEIEQKQQIEMKKPNLTVKFMHWNVLADKLSDAFPKVPPIYLKWEYRFRLIILHIKEVDPDCIGLSELDVLPLYKEIAQAMHKLGYSDYFQEKSNGISGSAIFYKKDKFICVENGRINFSEEDSQFFIYCKLAPRIFKSNQKNKKTQQNQQSIVNEGVFDKQRSFVFAETHLKAKPKNMLQRSQQCLKITEFFEQNYQKVPVIIGGDFNEEPQNDPIKNVMESHFIDLYSIVKIQSKQYSQENLQNHQSFTTYKFREESGFVKRTIDYMFFAENEYYQNNKSNVIEYYDNNDLNLQKLLNDVTGFPCENYPSDHLSIAYKLYLEF